MSWTRLDDSWTDQADIAGLDFAVRWHYLTMIQFCCRNGRHEGLMRRVDALRCSDMPDPERALSALVTAGKIEIVGESGVRLLDIAQHVPPEWVVKKAQRDREAKRRARAHKAGDHTLCIFGSGCPDAPGAAESRAASRDDSHDDIHDERRDGTGQDGAGNYAPDTKSGAEWNVVDIPRAATR